MTACPTDPDELPNDVPLNIKVSVHLITYNHAPYIRQAIESVLMQTANFPFEICIGEDDSTDGTREICQEYARLHPKKIRLFLRHDKDKIYICGRKTGKANGMKTREACRGKYVAFLEGDDFWIDATKLQKQYEFMESNPQFPMCATRCLFWYCNDSKNTIVMPRWKQGKFISYYELVRGACVHTSTYFCKREEIINLPQWTLGVLPGDYALTFTLGRKCGGLPILERLTSVYRITGDGIWSGSAFDKRNDVMIHFWETFLKNTDGASDPIVYKAAHRELRYLYFNKRFIRHKKGVRKLIFRILAIVFFPSIILPFLQNHWRKKTSDLIWHP